MGDVSEKENLLTPEEAALLMSQCAGYKVTVEDLKQLRRRGKIKPMKQHSRTTLYAREEVVKAQPPKKRHPELISRDIASFSDIAFPSHATSSLSLQKHTLETIPAEFYRNVLRDLLRSPQQQSTAISHRIVQQLFDYLDPGDKGLRSRQRNIHVGIALCVRPREGNQVRSLRKITWENLEQTRFFGAESLVGRAVTKGSRLLQSEGQRNTRRNLFYDEELSGKSLGAFPILRGGCLAGSFYVSSSQANYFTEAHLNVMQDYIDLLAITLDANDFYPLEKLELGVMPEYTRQQQLLEQQATRFVKIMNDKTVSQNEAVQKVWQELEEEMLSLPRMLDEQASR